MRRLLVRLLAGIGTLTIVCALLAGLLLLFATRLLVTHDRPAPADAIVVLGGGIGRAIHAAWLYNQGFAPKVYVSRPQVGMNRDMLSSYGFDLPFEQDIHVAMLRKDGVPDANIVLYGQNVLSTVEEAESLRAALPTTPSRLILVTSPYHTRRAKLVFERVFPETEILAIATISPPARADWWNDRRSALMVVLETAKLAYWYAGGAFRSHGVAGATGN